MDDGVLLHFSDTEVVLTVEPTAVLTQPVLTTHPRGHITGRLIVNMPQKSIQNDMFAGSTFKLDRHRKVPLESGTR